MIPELVKIELVGGEYDGEFEYVHEGATKAVVQVLGCKHKRGFFGLGRIKHTPMPRFFIYKIDWENNKGNLIEIGEGFFSLEGR